MDFKNAVLTSEIDNSVLQQTRQEQLGNPESNFSTTWNGAVSLKSSLNSCVDLFYKTSRGINKDTLFSLLEKSFWENSLVTLKIIAYCRDIRGGKGEREIGRYMMTWLANRHPDYLKVNLDCYIKEYGRYDDLVALLGTPLEDYGIQMWVDQLKRDLEIITRNNNGNGNGNGDDNNNGNKKSVSLVAKWIPSEHKSIDKKHKVVAKICKKIGISKANYRKNYLVPLRKHLDILESKMCSSNWNEIEFSKVPSVAMKNHNGAFKRHQLERFQEYLDQLASGKTKVNAKDLFPHQIVEGYLKCNSFDQLLESQWNVFVENVSKNYNIDNTLVLSDVSGSMECARGIPMNVSLALGLLISQCAKDPWKDLVLTFESEPRFHNCKGETLYDRIQILKNAPWGGSTDFNAALRKVLEVAKTHNVSQDDMPKRLIVVSDMQFDKADRSYNTNFESLEKMYALSGYKMPQIVFWNVNGESSDVPVESTQKGVSLVSGFSTFILKSILSNIEITPVSTMKQAIDDPRYDLVKLPNIWELHDSKWGFPCEAK